MKNYNKYIIWSIFIIAGLILFLIDNSLSNEFWKNTIKSIAGAIMITGTFSVLHSLVEQKDEENFFANMFSISMAVKDSGLLDIKTDSKDYSFKSILNDSKTFTVILNDGRSWVQQNYTNLKERLDVNGTSTNFYLVDPNGLFIPALAKKTNYEQDKLKDKINECVTLLKRIYDESQKKGTLTISFLKNYPTQSLFFADNKVIVTPYQVACGRNTVPVYVYSYKNGQETIGQFLFRDLKNVKAESRMIWNNGNEIRA